MSIIHDALKKVQQGLSPKTDGAPVSPSETAPKGPAYLYSTPPPVETLTDTVQQIAQQKLPVKNKIQSMSVLICTVVVTLAITIASIEYIYQQFQNNMPKVQNFAQKSINTLIRTKNNLSFPGKAPKELKPMAQITVNPAAPVTLNIHGIMSNGTGNVVLINDQVYQEGDQVDGAKITKINLDSITVNINGTDQTIPVKNQ